MRFDKIFKEYRVEKIARKWVWLQPMRNGEKFGQIQYLDKNDELFNIDDFKIGTEVTLFCTTTNEGTSRFPKYICKLEDLASYKSKILDNFLYADDYSEEAYKELERFKWDEETLSKIESHKKTSLISLTSVKFETKEELEDAVEYRMPFGKYKKCLVRLIPADYINWLYNQILENKIDNEEVIEAVTARVKLDELNAKCESEDEIEETLTQETLEEKKIKRIKETCIKEQRGFCEYSQVDSIDFEKEGYKLMYVETEYSNPFEFESEEDDTFSNHVVVYGYYKEI